MSTTAQPAAGGAPAEPTVLPPGTYPPLEGATRIIGSIALSTAVFMTVLDTSICLLYTSKPSAVPGRW